MKRIILLLLACLLFFGFTSANAAEESQKFNVTITVNFKAKTLQELADKENEIRKLLKDGEDVRVNIEFEKDCPSCPNASWSLNTDTKAYDNNGIAIDNATIAY